MLSTVIIIIIAVIIILSLLYFLAHYNIWRPIVSNNIPRVLMYHSVNQKKTHCHPELVITPRKLEQQLQYFQRKKIQLITIDELITNTDIESCAVLSFDDGFVDNYTELFPLLKKYQAKATIYLAPDIKEIDKLNPEQIMEMQASGLVEFGAHTLDHINLTKLDDKEAEVQIIKSKEKVEQLIKQPCLHFSYPFGRFEEKHTEMVKAAGFKSAVTVKKGIEKISNPFLIKRISILGSINIFQFHIAYTRGRYRV